MTVTGGLCLHFTLITPQSPTTLQTGHSVGTTTGSNTARYYLSHTSHNILTNIFTILGFCSPNGREEVNCIGLPSFQYINMSNFTTTHFKCPHILSSPSNLALFKHPFVSKRERFLIMSQVRE